jgi:hypothetical protein
MKDLIIVFTPIFSTVVAIYAVYLATRQARTAALKLKYDMFDRRMLVYNSLMDFIGAVLRDMNFSNDDLYRFLQSINVSYFLFGEEIFKYLEQVRVKGVFLRVRTEQLNSPHTKDKDRTKLIEERQELFQWFEEQYEFSRKKFQRYLLLT